MTISYSCGLTWSRSFAGVKGDVDIYDSVANKWSTVEPLSFEMSFEISAYLVPAGPWWEVDESE